MDPCIPIPLDEKTLNDVVEKAKDYCLMHGKYHLICYLNLPIFHFIVEFQ